MIDTHCHLSDPRLFRQLAAVLARAATAGVGRMVSIATERDDWHATLNIVRGRENIRCALGIHPNYAHEASLEQLEELKQVQADPCVVALGEMGLDYHYDFAPKARQKIFFETQLQIAQQCHRPVVIHCREATDDCLAILRNFPEISCDFHCFTGTMDESRKILDAGHMMGFTGAVTFKNNEYLRQVAALVPLDRLMVETDAPYLTPEPMRKQKINEPAMMVHVVKMLAAVKQMTFEEIEKVTSGNARRFYRWQ